MAVIGAARNDRVFSIKKWLGLNQNPDGDTKLRYGEAAVMRNWRITRDGNLRRRPGTGLIADIPGDAPVRRLWSGNVAGLECVLAASNGRLYRLFDGAGWETEDLGAVNTSGDVFIFGFDENAYILDGQKYRVYNGTGLSEVEGYRPLVVTASVPAGGGTTIEQVNKLNGLRRAQFSPDGDTVFFLPEQNIRSVDYVKNLVTGENMTGYTVDLETGSVTFSTAPEAGVNTVEIGWTVPKDFRYTVERMRYAELYNGSQDSRVFLYGDGSNQVYYSGLDTDGNPRADYFPDMNMAEIGESNTPVTALIRHSSRLMAFKTNGAYSLVYGSMTLADGSTIADFTVTPVNRTIGNVAPGQVQLVLNYPRTLFGEDCYEWKNSSSYSSIITADERQARRISDRVQATLKQFDLARCRCWDDNDAQEYYICYEDQALVHNYAADAWYHYTNFDAQTMCNFRGELYTGTSDGRVLLLSEVYKTDCKEAIPAYWESGAMDFNAEYMRKYSSVLWVVIKPESNSYVEVTVRTDRKSNFAVKTIATGTGTFSNWDFASFSFANNAQPQTKRLRIKAKKYAYYKLIFQTEKPETTATVLAADIRVRQTGYAK